jgi:phosphoglucomutase
VIKLVTSEPRAEIRTRKGNDSMEQVMDFANALNKIEKWLSYPNMEPKLRRDLAALEERLVKDSGDKETKEEILDRFYKDLDFGTGGIRGILGAGTNRMNIFTVRRVTQGFADYLNRRHDGTGKRPSVAIAYDSRNRSVRFALEASSVLAGNGIEVYIYPEIMPTPALSFAVRYYGCSGGIMITASHNPANYNGYKVYNEEGCQVTSEAADQILACIEKVDYFDGIKTADMETDSFLESTFFESKHHELINIIPQETVDAYIEAVKATRVGVDCGDLEVVFTPLNGTGNKPVRRILEEIGVEKVHVVPEQENPDGNFPTCPYPNPEKEEALLRGLALCRELETPDLLLATDPDCDRLGIAVRQLDKEKGGPVYTRLTGNEVGVLLLDFLCSNRRLPEKPVAMKTIVSTKMAEAVASVYGVEMMTLPTGFKYIGEKIGMLEKKGQADRFIFAFEESLGYLAGPYVRDKDGVSAAMLVCEAAAYYKKQGKTLVDRMEELYNIYGWYRSDVIGFRFEGVSGINKMKSILSKLRQAPPEELAGLRITEYTDYSVYRRWILGGGCDMAAGYRPTGLPSVDVLEYILEDGSGIILRPSGTEPKLKIYISAKGTDSQNSKDAIEKLRKIVKEWVL